jgi:selenocysteine lyase/cysteine desulfurase
LSDVSDRFLAAVRRQRFDLVWLSDVFFNSGFAMPDIAHIAAASGDAMVVVDGYHSFLARPVDFAALAPRAFYLAGGYKYAMSGEGVCFMHCPPGWGARPRDTGWYAAFGALSGRQDGVPYAEDGWRFMGATFDPSGLYRFNAALRWMQEQGITPRVALDHAHALQARFLAGLPGAGFADWPATLMVTDAAQRVAFLTFRRPDAAPWHARLAEANIVTDLRADRLRVGFGLYQSASCVDRLLERMGNLETVPAAA